MEAERIEGVPVARVGRLVDRYLRRAGAVVIEVRRSAEGSCTVRAVLREPPGRDAGATPRCAPGPACPR